MSVGESNSFVENAKNVYVTSVSENYNCMGTNNVTIEGTYTGNSSGFITGQLVSMEYNGNSVTITEGKPCKDAKIEVSKMVNERVEMAMKEYVKIIDNTMEEAIKILVHEEATEIIWTDSWVNDGKIKVKTFGKLIGERVEELIELHKAVNDALDIWYSSAVLVSENNDIEPFNIIAFVEKVNKLIE